jgi:hypothetical protein
MTQPAPVKYIALLRDGKSHVLTVDDTNIWRTLEHETKINKATIIGEYTSLRIAERAAELAERGWRQHSEMKQA